MSSANTTTTVAFFGATGGVVNATLVHTLKAGYKATALVRTPQKLRAQLTSQGLDDATIDATLTIVQGDATDVAAVKRTLLTASPTFIVTGVGAAPKFDFDLRHPGQIMTIDQPSLCGDAAQTLVTALREIYTEKPELKANRPLLVFISTTGITRGPEDVPFGMRFLYHKVLAVPHKDKKRMEDIFRAELEAEGDQGVFRSVVGIRPTLLKGAASYTDAAGLQSVKYGTEARPATGFTIKRADVGHFVFQNVISATQRKKEFEGEMISLTS
jgi:NAD(P)-dependent dehydrogenase (short-subunit alcohol dehydrogenase family)